MAKRVGVGAALAVLFIVTLYFGVYAEALLFTVAALLVVYELGHAFLMKGYECFLVPAHLFAAAMALWLLFARQLPVSFLWMGCVTAVIVERIFNKNRTTEQCFYSMVPLVYPLPFFAALLLIVCRFNEEYGRLGLLISFVCPLLGDSFGYFAGSAIGKTKMCPAISPYKTWEGCVASFTGSVLASLFLFCIQSVWGSDISIKPLLVLGMLCGVLGQIGDLFASVIKRWAGIKDFSGVFPGHGGVLDRLDSVLFCAPAVYACFCVFIK